jgi:molybdopterin synthase sulfur carrier subunit
MMSQVVVHVPASLRQYAAGARQWTTDCGQPLTLMAVFERMHSDYPGVVERALDENGVLRQHVNVFVDGQSIRAGASLGLQTPVSAGAEVWILPAVSGG